MTAMRVNPKPSRRMAAFGQPQMAVPVFFAAARGAATPGASVRRTASGTRPAAGTSTSASALPEPFHLSSLSSWRLPILPDGVQGPRHWSGRNAFRCEPIAPATERRHDPAIEAHFQFLLWLIPAVEKFPRGQRFLLSDRIQTTVLDVLEALIDATYSRDRNAVLRRANLCIEKLRFLFRLATARSQSRHARGAPSSQRKSYEHLDVAVTSGIR